jgi:D-glycero-D-manno-heptose 1,7-bisphosphate phosphatase
MRRAVFLDRDGVINRAEMRNGKPHPPMSLSALEILPGVPKALRVLREAGWLLIVITNQPDVARGITPLAIVESIHKNLLTKLPLDEIRTCYHDDNDRCDCRKPHPGALLSAATHHRIDLCASFMVGDRWRDIEAGESAGCKTIFIDYGYNERRPTRFGYRVQNLMEAAEIILGSDDEED